MNKAICFNNKCEKNAIYAICGQIYSNPELTAMVGEITAFACEEHLEAMSNENHIAEAIKDGMSKTPEGYEIPDQTFTMVNVFSIEDFKKMQNKNLNKCAHSGCTKAAVNSVLIHLAPNNECPPAITSEIMKLCREHSKVKFDELVGPEQWEALCLSLEAAGKARPKKKYSKLIFETISNLN